MTYIEKDSGPFHVRSLQPDTGSYPLIYLQHDALIGDDGIRKTLSGYEEFLYYPLARVALQAREIQQSHDPRFTGVFFVTQYMAGAIETPSGRIKLLGDIHDTENLPTMWQTMAEQGKGMILIGIAAGHTQHPKEFETVGLRIALPFDQQSHPTGQGSGDWIYSVQPYVDPQGVVEVNWFDFQTPPDKFHTDVAKNLFDESSHLWDIVHAQDPEIFAHLFPTLQQRLMQGDANPQD